MTPEQRQALEQNEAPWSELDKGLKEAFFLAVAMYGEPWLWQSDLGGFVPSQQGQIPTQSNETVYRLAPEPQRPAVIPWDHIDERFTCAAMKANNQWYFYVYGPRLAGTGWTNFSAKFVPSWLTFDRGNMPWDQSLVWRPGHEPKGEE